MAGNTRDMCGWWEVDLASGRTCRLPPLQGIGMRHTPSGFGVFVHDLRPQH
jgi:CxxC motif-containing protein (DUF1111 family)